MPFRRSAQGAIRGKGRRDYPQAMSNEEIELLTQRLTPGLGAYVVLLVSGLFLPVIAVIGYLGIALYYIIPFRRLSAGFLTWRSYKKHHRG